MAKTSSSYHGSNGGIGGSGIFGHFGSNTICMATDTSMYCTLMKIFNVFMVFIIVSFIIYMAYSFFKSRK
jgi:hypothetical protein